MGGDFPVLDAIVDVRKNPVLDVMVHLFTAVNQGHVGAVTPQVEGGNGSRVLPSDHQHLLVVIGVGVVVIVQHLGQLFPRDFQVVWQVIVTSSQDDLASPVGPVPGKPVDRGNREISVFSSYAA